MSKPYFIVVTGRPGSGKTTFSGKLGAEICMPVISRDRIKEGYLHTWGKSHRELPDDTNQAATDIFFHTLLGLIESNVSVIAEAAFQHRVWSTMLAPFMDKARICLLICKVDAKIALDRYVRRGLDHPLREYFHGDKGVDMARKGMAWTAPRYEEPRIGLPTFHIDTTGAYSPTLQEIREQIGIRLGEPDHKA